MCLPRNKIDRSILQGETVESFRSAIRSPWTRDPYERRLIAFLTKFALTPDEFVTEAKMQPSLTEKKILSFISSEKLRAQEGEISASTVGNCLKAIKVFLIMNDVSLNWEKIRRTLPKVRRYALDRIPTVKEIQDIIEASDLRGKALTLVLVSSGIREGAIPYLKIGNYTQIRSDERILAGILVVYEGEPEKYITFITAEACQALDKYLRFRKENGESIREQSPLFRDKFDPIKGKYGHGKESSKERIIAMSGASVRQYYNRLLYSIGIRTEKKRRHDFAVHGFRKFFKTKAELGGMKPINVEILMDHSTGISDSYYRPSEKELLDDYLKVTNHLTVASESRIKMELEELAEEKQERDKDILELKDKINTLTDWQKDLNQLMKNPSKLSEALAKDKKFHT